MVPNLKALILFVLFAVVAAQPPRGNGLDGDAFRAPSPEQTTRSFPSPSPGACRSVRIRPIDGRCTHKFRGELGRAGQVHFSYFDVDSTTFDDQGRKSARVISNIVANQDEDIFSERHLNELTTFFGQFLDHNFASTPLGEEEMEIERDEERDDPELELPFRRSDRDPVGSGERPVNVLTGAIDLVAVYGNNEMRNQRLRVEGSCRLKTSEGDLLPFNDGTLSNAPTTGTEFYVAGDTRSNEHPILTTLHTIWVREHNFLCERIERVDGISPERQYEIARAINIAEFQKIVYEEFFPAITGRVLSPPYRGFRGRANPTLSSLFSTAAFRVGHTMVGDRITKISRDGSITTESLAGAFFVAGSVAGGIDPILRGVTSTKSQEIDVKVVNGLRNMLFRDVEEEEGPDLIALNLQRSRDHNIPSFNRVRRFCGIRTATSFADITSDPEIQRRLSEAYETVDDVEAWIGLMAEDHMPRSSMGRTLFAVWRKEFLRLRDGDQFFFRNRRGFFASLRNQFPELVNPILRRRNRIFRSILLRNSGVRPREINRRNVFVVPK